MVYQSRAALDGVAGALFVVYTSTAGVSLRLSRTRHPKFLLLFFFSLLRIATAGLQIDMYTAPWQQKSAWLALIEVGHPVLTLVISLGTSMASLAASGRVKDRFWNIISIIVCGIVAVALRIAGSVQIGREYSKNDPFITASAVYVTGEGFNHSAICTTVILGFVLLPKLLSRRKGGYAYTIRHRHQNQGLWATFLNRGLTREEIIAKYQDPHYLIWYSTSLALLPMLIARHVYSALNTYYPKTNSRDWPFFPLEPNVGALAGLCYIPEAVIVVVLLVVGWNMPDDPYVAAPNPDPAKAAANTSIEMQPVDD